MSYPHFSVDCGDHHGLVRDFGGPRPTITVLCGSTRYPDVFREQNLRLTLAGHIVLSIGCNLRERKIDLADEVLVLNVDGYVGDSTRSEIEYAQAHGKPVRFLVETTEGARA
ncbi:MAG TPA: hypothetical protein VFY14_02675 [Streptomyces sp.]|nr:hypothetical protein [Streptomyces sp.]